MTNEISNAGLLGSSNISTIAIRVMTKIMRMICQMKWNIIRIRHIRLPMGQGWGLQHRVLEVSDNVCLCKGKELRSSGAGWTLKDTGSKHPNRAQLIRYEINIWSTKCQVGKSVQTWMRNSRFRESPVPTMANKKYQWTAKTTMSKLKWPRSRTYDKMALIQLLAS